MLERFFTFITLLIIVGMPVQFARAQHYAKIDDRRGIELALDMIRKGVQEQDTGKIMMVSAPVVLTEEKEMNTKAQLAARLQTAFVSASGREYRIEKPIFTSEYEKLRSSNFWDFDILEPKITISGDTAFVDCELVLWGATVEPNSKQHGQKIPEKFVFYSPPKVPLTELPEDSEAFQESGGNKIPNARSWQLVATRSLMALLEGGNKQSPDMPATRGGAKR